MDWHRRKWDGGPAKGALAERVLETGEERVQQQQENQEKESEGEWRRVTEEGQKYV